MNTLCPFPRAEPWMEGVSGGGFHRANSYFTLWKARMEEAANYRPSIRVAALSDFLAPKAFWAAVKITPLNCSTSLMIRSA